MLHAFKWNAQVENYEKSTETVELQQESVQDLQEDTQAKLNQMWEALTKRNDEMDAASSATRTELLAAISSSMELIKGLGDAVERIELTDMADLQKHMEAMAQTMEEEQTSVRQQIEDTAQVFYTCFCMRSSASGLNWWIRCKGEDTMRAFCVKARWCCAWN